MPISKDEWDKGRKLDPFELQVLQFLSDNRGNAFTIQEIIEGMKFKFGEGVLQFVLLYSGVFGLVQSSLESLMRQGKVVGKIISTPSGPTSTQPYFMVP